MKNIVSRKLDREIIRRRYRAEDTNAELQGTFYSPHNKAVITPPARLLLFADDLYFKYNVQEKLDAGEYHFYKD